MGMLTMQSHKGWVSTNKGLIIMNDSLIKVYLGYWNIDNISNTYLVKLIGPLFVKTKMTMAYHIFCR